MSQVRQCWNQVCESTSQLSDLFLLVLSCTGPEEGETERPGFRLGGCLEGQGFSIDWPALQSKLACENGKLRCVGMGQSSG